MCRLLGVSSAVLFTALVASAVASAQMTHQTFASSPGPSVQDRFNRLDANHDGKLSWNEARPAREAEFGKLDANHDGILTPDEFNDRALPFAAFDRNRDGKITGAEYLGRHKDMFQRADTDHDGAVSLAEFTRTQQAIRNSSKGETTTGGPAAGQSQGKLR